jgi:hypothetical protein
MLWQALLHDHRKKTVMLLPHVINSKGLNTSLLRRQIQVQSPKHRSRSFAICIRGSRGNDRMARARRQCVEMMLQCHLKRPLRVIMFARELCIWVTTNLTTPY